MKKILLTIALLLGLNTVVRSERVAPYSGSRIFWDMNSQMTVFNSGNYARMIELQDGRLLAVAEAGGGISIAISENKGKTVAILLQPSKSATVPALLNSGHSIKVVTAYHMENLTPVKTVTVIDENNTTYPAQV